MGELSSLPNISKVIEGKLNQADIYTKDQLVEAGSKDAFLRIRMRDPAACVNMLMAIEGAIEGMRWHGLLDGKKAELREFYNTL